MKQMIRQRVAERKEGEIPQVTPARRGFQSVNPLFGAVCNAVDRIAASSKSMSADSASFGRRRDDRALGIRNI